MRDDFIPDFIKNDEGQTRAGEAGANLTGGLEHGLPGYVTTGFSRAEWHDKAWALYHAKTFDDTMLAKASIHTIRTVFDATFDALMEVERSNLKGEQRP